jgi:hypothetical protein
MDKALSLPIAIAGIEGIKGKTRRHPCAARRGLGCCTRLAANSCEPPSPRLCYFLTRCTTSIPLRGPHSGRPDLLYGTYQHTVPASTAQVEAWRGNGAVPHHALSEEPRPRLGFPLLT